MGNSSGGYSTTRERTMAAYDRLPPSVRRALQDAVFDWAVQPFRTAFERQRQTAKEIVKRIQTADKNHVGKLHHRRGHNDLPWTTP